MSPESDCAGSCMGGGVTAAGVCPSFPVLQLDTHLSLLPSPPVLHCASIKPSRLLPNDGSPSEPSALLPPSLAPRPLSARAGQLSGTAATSSFRGGTSRQRAGDRALCSAVSWKLKPPGQMFWVTAALGARAGLRDI